MSIQPPSSGVWRLSDLSQKPPGGSRRLGDSRNSPTESLANTSQISTASSRTTSQVAFLVRGVLLAKHCITALRLCYQGSHTSWKVLDSFFLENSRTWKVLENHFGPGKSWKLKLTVLESPGKISLKVMHFPVVQMENKQQ